MNLFKAIVPVVLIKKLYGRGYKKTDAGTPSSEEKKDRLEDLKDDDS